MQRGGGKAALAREAGEREGAAHEPGEPRLVMAEGRQDEEAPGDDGAREAKQSRFRVVKKKPKR